jgi:glycerate dehydrogenase
MDRLPRLRPRRFWQIAASTVSNSILNVMTRNARNMQIVVLDGYALNPGDNPWDAIEKLGDLRVHDRTAEDQIVARAREAEIVLTNKTPLTAETLRQLPQLKFISVLATGYNIVDVQAAAAHGIPVSNVPEYGTDSVAQHVFAVLLHFCHHATRHDQLIREGHWQQCGDFSFWDTPLLELAGKQIGIVGFGRIGQRVGELAHAFGMRVTAYDPTPGQAPAYSPFAWQSLAELFSESDVVSLHCPETDENRNMINRQLLATMKRTSILINAARGGLVNEQDLAMALNEGQLAGAALDVLSQEPVRDDNPMLAASNCLLTPHTAWATVAARQRLMAVTAENVSAFLKGDPCNVVNELDAAQ